MHRLLVTGGAGFVGCNFVHHWLGGHPQDRLVVLDALTYAGNLANLTPVESHPGFRFVHGDICDGDLVIRLLREERIDTIVHFAAESHVDRSISGPAAFMQTNVMGTHTLLQSARTVWLQQHAVEQHRFHHVSTDEVYGSLEPHAPPFRETTPYAPNSPYSASKAAADHLVRSYYRTYGLQVTTSNCSNNYGPYHFAEKLIPLTIVNILHGRPLPVYGDGRNVRDWLHVADHCRAIELILEGGRAGQSYNIGARAEIENIQLVRLLCDIAARAFEAHHQLRERYPGCPVGRISDLIRFVPDRPGHDRRYAIDSTKIEQQLGFAPRVALLAGLADTFTWFTANPDWWRAAVDELAQKEAAPEPGAA